MLSKHYERVIKYYSVNASKGLYHKIVLLDYFSFQKRTHKFGLVKGNGNTIQLLNRYESKIIVEYKIGIGFRISEKLHRTFPLLYA